MPDVPFADELRPVAEGAAFVLLFMVVFVLGRRVHQLTSTFDVEDELTVRDNAALAISVAGFYLGLAIIYVGALLGPSYGLQHDLLLVGGYALGGIALLLVARLVNDALILPGFSADEEILRDQNPGTGAVQFGSYVASALIVAGSIHGQGGGPLSALVFFALGQLALVAFTWLYDFTTPHSLHAEIETDNTAAGIGFSGALVAIGLIIARAVSGDFLGWGESLAVLGLDILIVFAYLVGVRVFFDRFVLPDTDLTVEITTDRNVGAGLLEFAVSLGFAGVLFFLL
jgi:uncharacterized membrane protein YjfL (UPF0719 family)